MADIKVVSFQPGKRKAPDPEVPFVIGQAVRMKGDSKLNPIMTVENPGPKYTLCSYFDECQNLCRESLHNDTLEAMPKPVKSKRKPILQTTMARKSSKKKDTQASS